MPSIQVLLVEDNEGDIRLTVEALRESNLPMNLTVARDGEEALMLLRRGSGFHEAPQPNLIILDLNLPRKDGRELLSEIKTDPLLALIPVVVLTTSDAKEDVASMYRLHANCYITKPFDLDELIRVVRSIREFWFSVVRLPETAL